MTEIEAAVEMTRETVALLARIQSPHWVGELFRNWHTQAARLCLELEAQRDRPPKAGQLGPARLSSVIDHAHSCNGDLRALSHNLTISSPRTQHLDRALRNVEHHLRVLDGRGPTDIDGLVSEIRERINRPSVRINYFRGDNDSPVGLPPELSESITYFLDNLAVDAVSCVGLLRLNIAAEFRASASAGVARICLAVRVYGLADPVKLKASLRQSKSFRALTRLGRVGVSAHPYEFRLLVPLGLKG